MGIAAITHRDDGSKVAIPTTPQDWRQWISAGKTRNWMLDDPLLDWLNLYGKDHDYLPKQESADYVKELDFLAFIFDKAQEFEVGILRLFQDQYEVTAIAQDYREITKPDKAEATYATMRRGVPIIYQAVLWDAHNLNYGSPDFLIRSDILRQLFPNEISEQQAAISAPDLGNQGWHYLVVDTKFTTLHLNASGAILDNSNNNHAYKAQLYIYNRMLGCLQGFLPPNSYLLGRGWQRKQGKTYRGTSAMERLAPIPQNGTIARNIPIADAVADALDWIRRVRAHGHHWQLLPEPSVPELYPNMSNADDGDLMLQIRASEPEPDPDESESADHWISAKKWLASELKELTQLWYVGFTGRQQAHASGIYRWDAPDLTAAAVGVKGDKTGPTLDRILAVNTPNNAPPILPRKIENIGNEWRKAAAVEFYVDFEFCSDLNDDFTNLPEKGGQPIIFMIGCGHLEQGKWQFQSFTVPRLDQDEELRIIQEWLDYMSQIRDRLDPSNPRPRIFHWSHAAFRQPPGSVFQFGHGCSLRRLETSRFQLERQSDDLPAIRVCGDFDAVVVYGGSGEEFFACGRLVRHDFQFPVEPFADGFRDTSHS